MAVFGALAIGVALIPAAMFGLTEWAMQQTKNW